MHEFNCIKHGYFPSLFHLDYYHNVTELNSIELPGYFKGAFFKNEDLVQKNIMFLLDFYQRKLELENSTKYFSDIFDLIHDKKFQTDLELNRDYFNEDDFEIDDLELNLNKFATKKGYKFTFNMSFKDIDSGFHYYIDINLDQFKIKD